MKSSRFKRSMMASLLSFLLIFSSLIPAVGATGQDNRDLNTSNLAKVTEDVYEALEENEFVEILVEMEEQVDTSEVALQAKAQQLTNATPADENLFTRTAVVDALKSTAEKSQATLLEQLEGNESVSDIESFYIMNVVYVKAKKEAVEEIRHIPGVKRIKLDEKIEIDFPEITSEEQDLLISQSDSNTTYNEDPTVEWNIDRVDAPLVWDEFGVDGNGVVVGIIDSGAHWTHEALMEKWRGYDPLNPDAPNPVGNWFDPVEGRTMPYDISQPHGTHVLGTILGQDPAGENKVGVAPGAEWIAARAFTAQGGQQSWLLASGEFMLAPNDDPSLAPDIINNSWGGGPGRDEWYRPMVQAWKDAEIVPVFAGGNDYASIATPANYPESYAVGATDNNNLRADFSNVGPSPYPEDNLKPDISAPGVNIRSTVPNGYAGGWDGTSMAAPHVAGVAALLRSVDPALTVDDIENIINETATPLTDDRYTDTPNFGYGHGLVNAYGAVNSIIDGMGGVTGTVLKKGSDEEAPVITHEEETFQYKSLDLTLEAQVTDNVSVTATELFVRSNDTAEWESYDFERTTGNYLEGTYEITVPAEYVQLPGFEYKIRATDFSGNIAETEVFEVEVAFGINPAENFTHDFETELEGMLMSGDWEHGVPETGPTPNEGEQLVATNLTGEYSNQSESFLQFPPIDLRETADAQISLNHWFDIEYQYDFGKVLITNDITSNEWDVLETFSGRERSWDTFSIDLSDYANEEEQVFVGLLLESDNETTHEGWYVDHLTITNAAETEANEVLETITLNQKTSENNTDNPAATEDAAVGLPVEAYVSVVESGRTARTSLEDGSFNIIHGPTPEGEAYTLRVESYGYYPQEISFELAEGEVIDTDFLLEEIPRGQISVTVENQDGEPVEDAQLSLVEDQRVDAIETDEDGNILFENILEGEYTVRAEKDNFYTENVEVEVSGGETAELSVTLNEFPGDLIKYDEGVADNALAFNTPGLGFVTRMTPEEETNVIGTSVYLWGEDFPNPGGDGFAVTVYDSNEDGEPGERVFDPKPVEGVRGEWNYIDISEYEFRTGDDYYVVILMPNDPAESPGVGVDGSDEYAERAYIFDSGSFDDLGSNYGNLLIRSHVSADEAPDPDPEPETPEAPVLDIPEEAVYTNEAAYLVTGTTEEDGEITIYNEEEAITSGETTSQAFSIEVPLTEGENTFYATLITDGGESEASNELSIIQDVTAPVLSIDELPSRTNEPEVFLSGSVTDTHLDVLTIDETEVEVSETGAFVHRVELTEGQNSIEITATDLAGNISEETVEIELDTTVPVIHSVYPGEDIYLTAGESIGLVMTSDTEDGTAQVTVKNEKDEVLETVEMQHVEAGTYTAEWTLPSNVAEATFHYELEDDLGNENAQTADGSVIQIEKIDRIYGDTRFHTAIEVSNIGWDTADTVILTRGDEFADALAGIPLAHQINAPILMTHSFQLYEPVKEELERLQPEKVIILGGDEAIESHVEQELIALGIETERIAGPSRAETAVLIAEEMGIDPTEAIIVNGLDFPDAMTAASFAATEELPILLSLTDRLTRATEEALDEMNITETIVVGEDQVLTEEVLAQLPNPTRVGGSDRYETTVELFKHFDPNTELIYVATGREFADALTGATLAAKNNTGILLTHERVPASVESYLGEQDTRQLRIFGGPDAIAEDVYDAFERLLD